MSRFRADCFTRANEILQLRNTRSGERRVRGGVFREELRGSLVQY